MPSTPAERTEPQADPHDDIVAILRGGGPRMAHDPSELHIDAADRVAAAPPRREIPLQVEPLNDNRTAAAPVAPARPRRRVLRFLLAVGFGVAATVGWQSYGEAARQALATWVPQLAVPAPEQTETAAATDASEPVQLATASETSTAAAGALATPATGETAAAPAQAVPAQAAAAPAEPAADLAPLIEGMSREIASLRQAIEQLKADQEKMGRDITRTVEKTVDKAVEKAAAEPEPKRRVATPAPRPVAAPARNTAPPPPPPARQIASERQIMMPPPPMRTQLPPDPDYVYAPRPPMPLR